MVGFDVTFGPFEESEIENVGSDDGGGVGVCGRGLDAGPARAVPLLRETGSDDGDARSTPLLHVGAVCPEISN